MSDVNPFKREEPNLGSSAADAERARAAQVVRPPETVAVSPRTVETRADPVRTGEPLGSEALSRIEDKAARIEEKFARLENLMQRVESAALGLTDVARRPDVEILSSRVRRLPGFGALIVFAVIAAVLSAIALLAVVRYAPGLIPR